MARDPRRLRGDVNAALNGLIREGVISSFELPSLSGHWHALGILHVAVAAQVITDPRVPGYDRAKVLAIRNRVTKELEGVGVRDAVVSVRSARM